MGWGMVQSIVDFLVDETCHACGCRIESRERLPTSGNPAADVLGDALPALGAGPWWLRTRLLCRACTHDVVPWDEPVALSGDALEIYPAFATDARLLALIHVLKFGRRERVALWLAKAMALGLPARACTAGAVIVPVPMDRVSLRRRGFNQAESLAREFARLLGVSVLRGAIVKQRPTAAQSLLGREARERNLAGAVAPGPQAALLAERPVVLVDDLVTTGATARACSRALADAGAGTVRVACGGYRRLPPGSVSSILTTTSNRRYPHDR